jgi:hypothetical protein
LSVKREFKLTGNQHACLITKSAPSAANDSKSSASGLLHVAHQVHDIVTRLVSLYCTVTLFAGLLTSMHAEHMLNKLEWAQEQQFAYSNKVSQAFHNMGRLHQFARRSSSRLPGARCGLWPQ